VVRLVEVLVTCGRLAAGAAAAVVRAGGASRPLALAAAQRQPIRAKWLRACQVPQRARRRPVQRGPMRVVASVVGGKLVDVADGNSGKREAGHLELVHDSVPRVAPFAAQVLLLLVVGPIVVVLLASSKTVSATLAAGREARLVATVAGGWLAAV